MIDAGRISALFEEAAFEPSRLPEAFEKAAEPLRANMVYLLGLDGGRPALVCGPETLACTMAYEAEGWRQADDRTRLAAARRRQGLWLDADIVPEDVRRRSAFINEFSRAWDIPWCMGCGFLIDGEQWAIAALRRDSQGPFLAEERPALERLMPAVARAVLFAARLRTAAARGMAEGIHASGLAAVVLDHRGRCLFATPSAEALFDPELGLREGRLRAADPRADAALLRLASGAADLDLLATNVLVPRDAGGRDRPVLVLPVRVRGAGPDSLPGARSILMLIDLGARPRPRADLLRAMYGLTAAEAQVAQLLAGGASAERISEALGIQVSTVRQYVKSVLAKADVHRQAELVARIAQLPDTPIG